MAPPHCPRSPPELMDDLIGEILLRVPPDEPAHLVRAALVCKPWRRIIFDAAFLRRYREFHRTPPLLGFFRYEIEHHEPRFVSTTTTASPFSATESSFPDWWTLDCRHGRVLLYSLDDDGMDFILWDPITGDRQGFRMAEPEYPSPDVFSAAVLCVADSCNHLDCHGGPFLVVFAGTDEYGVTWVTEFSSETGAWSGLTVVDFSASKRAGLDYNNYVGKGPSLFTGDAVYFMLELDLGTATLRYDLGGRGLSVIDTPDVHRTGIVMTAEDGSLGFAGVKNYDLYLWSWKANAHQGIAGWVQLRVIELKTLLPIREDGINVSHQIIGFAEGTDTIFVSTNNCIFTLKLKSGQVRKVGQRLENNHGIELVPYMSFYTPDLVGVRPLLPC